MPLETVTIHFNYDPEILREAGVDLDSGTLAGIKQLLLEGLEERVEGLRDGLRYKEEGRSTRLLDMRRQLALIQALLAQE